MVTRIQITYDCCGSTYELNTAIPETGSALRHASAADTVIRIIDAMHDGDHPECETGEKSDGLRGQDP